MCNPHRSLLYQGMSLVGVSVEHMMNLSSQRMSTEDGGMQQPWCFSSSPRNRRPHPRRGPGGSVFISQVVADLRLIAFLHGHRAIPDLPPCSFWRRCIQHLIWQPGA
jgi:hypothetical protein